MKKVWVKGYRNIWKAYYQNVFCLERNNYSQAKISISLRFDLPELPVDFTMTHYLKSLSISSTGSLLFLATIYIFDIIYRFPKFCSLKMSHYPKTLWTLIQQTSFERYATTLHVLFAYWFFFQGVDLDINLNLYSKEKMYKK